MNAAKAPPLLSIFSPVAARRRVAVRYWLHDTFYGLLKYATHHVLRLLPTDWVSNSSWWSAIQRANLSTW